MTTWSTRQESMSQFSAYLAWLSHLEGNNASSNISNAETDGELSTDEDDLGALPPSLTKKLTHVLVKKPSFLCVDIEWISSNFKASKFLQAIQTFVQQAFPPPKTPILPNQFNHFDTFKVLSICVPDFLMVGRHNVMDHICAMPHVSGQSGQNDTPAHFDTVLV
jgi:hypothetical protein